MCVFATFSVNSPTNFQNSALPQNFDMSPIHGAKHFISKKLLIFVSSIVRKIRSYCH